MNKKNYPNIHYTIRQMEVKRKIIKIVQNIIDIIIGRILIALLQDHSQNRGGPIILVYSRNICAWAEYEQ